MIHLVPMADIDKAWPVVAEGMKEACRRCGDDVTAWHLLQWVRRSDALLFVWFADEEIKAGLVVRPETWGSEQVLRILAISGHNIDEWLSGLSTCDVWKTYVGDLPVIFEGREGWKRKVPNARVLRVVYRMEPNYGGR